MSASFRIVPEARPPRRHASPQTSLFPSPSPSPPLVRPVGPTRSLYTDMTTIHVGPPAAPTTFHAHTELLIATSPFFTAALSNTGWCESVTKTMSFPETDPDVFAFFLQWLYSRSLAHEAVDWDDPSRTAAPIAPAAPAATTATIATTVSLSAAKMTLATITAAMPVTTATPPASKRKSSRHVAFFHLIRLYVLAAFLTCDDLLNDLVDEVARVASKHNALPGTNDTHMLWGPKCQLGGMRNLVVDMYVGMKTAKMVGAAEDQWHEAFLRAVVVKEKEKKAGTVPGVPEVVTWKDSSVRCVTYHVHEGGKRCKGVWPVGLGL